MTIKKRYQPLSWEVSGYLKTFFWCWIVSWIVLIILGGANAWAFFGGMLLALPVAILIFLAFLFITGVKDKLDD